MPRKLQAFVAVAVLLAALFVRLGFWQLSRLEERKAFNAQRARPLSQPEIAFDSLRDRQPYRRVRLTGTPDFDHEFALAGRSRNGSPGVHVFTPFRRAGNDTAVLVNRGWVYSPDAASADLPRFREAVTSASGYTDTIASGGAPGPDASRPRLVRRVTREGVAALVPYPVHSTYVVMQDSGGAATPARLPLPELTNGPHLGYAIQWFAFAVIAVGGAAIVVLRGKRGRSAGSTAARVG